MNERCLQFDQSPFRNISASLGSNNRLARVPHLEKSDCCKAASSQGESRRGYEKQPSIRDKISSELHRFTIEFGRFFLSLNILLGPLWGYSFYYKRRLLSTSIVAIELLLIGVSLLWLL
jgi:hypothetical protein